MESSNRTEIKVESKEASKGLAKERVFVRDAHAREKATELQKRIDALGQELEAVERRIAEIVSRIQQGEKAAALHGSKVSGLSTKLREAAQDEKMKLLERRRELEVERQGLQEELNRLGHL